MSPELELLKILSTRENFNAYSNLIEKHVLTPGVSIIVDAIKSYYHKHPDPEIDWSAFGTWLLYVHNPSMSKAHRESVGLTLEALEKDPKPGPHHDAVLGHFVRLDTVARVLDKAIELSNGTVPDPDAAFEELREIIDGYVPATLEEMSREGMVDDSVEEIVSSLVRSSGVEWRFSEFNQAIGPLHPEDFIVIGACPEVGKTSLACSEVTHMATQLPDDQGVLILNNEESGRKLKLRLLQSALGMTTRGVTTDPANAEAEFKKMYGRRPMDVYHNADMTISEVDRIISRGNYGIVVFNILDKVRGFDKKSANEVDRIRRLFAWGRQLASRHGLIVFALAQAGSDAEGQKWVRKNNFYMNRTGIQAESDVIITIGSTFDPADAGIRYLHIPKNKLPGGPKTVESKRHGYFEARFDSTTGRFTY